MWAEKVLRLRDGMPGIEQALAGAVLRELRIRKTADEVAGAARRRRRHRPRARPDRGVAAGRAHRGARSAGTSPTRSSPRATSARTSSSSAPGPNGASPHHDVSDRVIQPGDPVVVDIGGTTEAGYCSD